MGGESKGVLDKYQGDCLRQRTKFERGGESIWKNWMVVIRCMGSGTVGW